MQHQPRWWVGQWGSGMARKRCHEEPDEDLVSEVRAYMKANKISQMVVKEQARVSQAVISQWLNLRYHGHTGKVCPARDMPTFSRPPSPHRARSRRFLSSCVHQVLSELMLSRSQVDKAMREWMEAHLAGQLREADDSDPTSVRRPTRCSTFGKSGGRSARRRATMRPALSGTSKRTSAS